MTKNAIVWGNGGGAGWATSSEDVADRILAAYHDGIRGVLGL
jgi:hypothetical protein